MSKKSTLFIIGLLVLLLDVVTKAWIYNFYSLPKPEIPIFSHLLGGIDFSLTYAANRGAAWGLFSEYQTPLLFLRIVFITALAAYLLTGSPKKGRLIPLTLILAGAFGNIIDTFIYGHVVDMFHFNFWGYDYPVFNVADTAITTGIVWILLVPSKRLNG